MSWDKQGEQTSSSFGSRPSNTLARLAFNIYGSSGGNSSSSAVSRASFNNNSRQQSPPKNLTPVYEVNTNDTTRVRYKSNVELIGLSRLNTENTDTVVVAGKTSLQLYRVGSTVAPVDDLLTSSYYMKNKKSIGTILDVKAGYGNYNKYIGTSTTTGSILIFNSGVKNNKLLFKYSDQTRAVNTISFSQIDHHLLLSGSQDGAMKLWDLRSSKGRPVTSIQATSDAIRSIQFSPYHNKKFAAISDSGVITKWDLRLPTQFEKKFSAHTGPGLCIDWHPEFDYIVSAGRDKQVQVWNMNGETRVPEHVIYAANPVSRVTWRPNIQSNSISAAELAMSFLNNDLTVQVYSLRRKYIPLYSIGSHSAQITGLSFKDDRYLLTCSKDKFFIKEDLALYPNIIDNLPLISTTWSPNNDLVFIDQQKREMDRLDSDLGAVSAAHSSLPMSTSPTSQAQVSIGLQSASSFMSTSHATSPRPGMSRASSRPVMSRGISQGSHFHHHSLASMPVMNPTAVPVTLPIMKGENALKYLAHNYIFDPSEDHIASCLKNSATATEVGNHRDAQTWNVLKESLIWEQQMDSKIDYSATDHGGKSDIVGDDTESLRSDGLHEKYHYSTSNSTNYGKSPSLSDLSETFNSANSRDFPTSIPNREHRLSIIKSIKSRPSFLEESEGDDSAASASDQAKTVTRADVLKWADVLKPDTTDDTIRVPTGDSSQDDNEIAVEFTDNITKPITLPHRKRSMRDSLLESILPHDGTTSPTGTGMRTPSSPTYSMTSSMSGTSVRPLTPGWTSLLSKQGLSKQTSHMSELTKQLTNQMELDTATTHFLPPFAPRRMILKAIEFSSGQGDLIMSCTLLLLFNAKYELYKPNMMKNAIYTYIEFLQRMRFWIPMTRILGLENQFEEFQQMSLNSTTVRRFCSNCGVLVINEQTKEKFLKDGNVIQFGAWFCEQCGCRSKCTYCNEPLKGLNIFRLKCGHSGHFGCFKSWIFDEGMDCCPGGC